jgi:chorismate mutase
VSDVQARLRAIRGATTIEHDTSADIAARTGELLAAILARNELPIDDIVSVIFTVTPDVTADFPAVAARQLGLSHTPLLCGQEIAVAGAIERCIRVLVHCYLHGDQTVHHVYLHKARQLRLDLPE